jgi:CD109 antigen
LEVQSLPASADSFYEKQFITLESATFSMHIETNKGSYRPGDVVKYRVLVLDADTRPIVVSASLSVSVLDASKRMIHQVTGKSAEHGVYSSEFQTSADDSKGVWTIEAEFKGKVS